jgi:hypothetical protein
MKQYLSEERQMWGIIVRSRNFPEWDVWTITEPRALIA